jgi:hypothetical protein
MTPQDFDVDAEEVPLFELDVASVPLPDDGVGTGDLLAELDESE